MGDEFFDVNSGIVMQSWYLECYCTLVCQGFLKLNVDADVTDEVNSSYAIVKDILSFLPERGMLMVKNCRHDLISLTQFCHRLLKQDFDAADDAADDSMFDSIIDYVEYFYEKFLPGDSRKDNMIRAINTQRVLMLRSSNKKRQALQLFEQLDRSNGLLYTAELKAAIYCPSKMPYHLKYTSFLLEMKHFVASIFKQFQEPFLLELADWLLRYNIACSRSDFFEGISKYLKINFEEDSVDKRQVFSQSVNRSRSGKSEVSQKAVEEESVGAKVALKDVGDNIYLKFNREGNEKCTDEEELRLEVEPVQGGNGNLSPSFKIIERSIASVDEEFLYVDNKNVDIWLDTEIEEDTQIFVESEIKNVLRPAGKAGETCVPTEHVVNINKDEDIHDINEANDKSKVKSKESCKEIVEKLLTKTAEKETCRGDKSGVASHRKKSIAVKRDYLSDSEGFDSDGTLTEEASVSFSEETQDLKQDSMASAGSKINAPKKKRRTEEAITKYKPAVEKLQQHGKVEVVPIRVDDVDPSSVDSEVTSPRKQMLKNTVANPEKTENCNENSCAPSVDNVQLCENNTNHISVDLKVMSPKRKMLRKARNISEAEEDDSDCKVIDLSEFAREKSIRGPVARKAVNKDICEDNNAECTGKKSSRLSTRRALTSDESEQVVDMNITVEQNADSHPSRKEKVAEATAERKHGQKNAVIDQVTQDNECDPVDVSVEQVKSIEFCESLRGRRSHQMSRRSGTLKRNVVPTDSANGEDSCEEESSDNEVKKSNEESRFTKSHSRRRKIIQDAVEPVARSSRRLRRRTRFAGAEALQAENSESNPGASRPRKIISSKRANRTRELIFEDTEVVTEKESTDDSSGKNGRHEMNPAEKAAGDSNPGSIPIHGDRGAAEANSSNHNNAENSFTEGESIRWSSEDEIPEPSFAPPRRRRRHHFSATEVMWLREGVHACGTGNWVEILRMFPFSHRTSGNLKDKWRNLLKKKT